MIQRIAHPQLMEWLQITGFYHDEVRNKRLDALTELGDVEQKLSEMEQRREELLETLQTY